MKAIEELDRDELLVLIYQGYRKMRIMSGDPAIAPRALVAGLEANGQKFADWFERSQVLQQCEKIMKAHNIPDDYVPPRILVRHALALMTAFNEVVKQMEHARGELVADTVVLQRGRKTVKTPEDAYQISDEEADHLLATIFRKCRL